MDRGQMSPWKNNLATRLLTVMLLFLQYGLLVSQEVTCAEDEHRHETEPFCCNKCPPGFHVEEDCASQWNRTKCKKCGDGRYRSDTNYFNACEQCTKCKDNEVEVSKCDCKNNRVCQCKEGYYKLQLSTNTHECRLCRVCGAGEREVQNCTAEHNRKCESRERCLKDCSQSCGPIIWPSTTTLPTTPQTNRKEGAEGHMLIIVVSIAIASITVLALGMILSYRFISQRCWTQEKVTLQSQRSEDSESPSSVLSTESLLIREDSSRSHDNYSVPYPAPTHMEKQYASPPCETPAINTNKFIYSLLEVVPVLRVEELLRRLDVSDQIIDRARRDHPTSCKEAHFHMLKAWSESGPRGGGGGGGGGGSLPLPLLRTMLETLREMNLRASAEILEEKYQLEHLGHT